MKIAVTGFLPFNGREVNPSQLIVEQLASNGRFELVKKILPVEYKASTVELMEFLEREKPDVLLSIGQAGNAPHIAVERVAINLDNARTSDGKSLFNDQAGEAPVDEPVRNDGPEAYFATLPVWDIIAAINDKGIPARASYSAGTFICNHVMYEGLHYAAKHGNSGATAKRSNSGSLAKQNGFSVEANCAGMTAGFIHVPFLPEQIKDNPRPGTFSMELKDMVTAVQTALEVLGG